MSLFAHMIQGHCPASMSDLLGPLPNLHPTAASRVSFRLLKLMVKFLIFLFLDLSFTAPLPGHCTHQAVILQTGPVSRPPPMECPLLFVSGLSSSCPGKVFHFQPRALPSHLHCPHSVPSQEGPDSQENWGSPGLGEWTSFIICSIHWMKYESLLPKRFSMIFFSPLPSLLLFPE